MTPKQHQFAREVVLGKSQADAYRSVYDTARMNDNSIRREASRLMDNPRVAQPRCRYARRYSSTELSKSFKVRCGLHPFLGNHEQAGDIYGCTPHGDLPPAS